MLIVKELTDIKYLLAESSAPKNTMVPMWISLPKYDVVHQIIGQIDPNDKWKIEYVSQDKMICRYEGNPDWIATYLRNNIN